ncbi:MAG: transposase, partial [Bacillota bacterium]|nr:transposase [Bacillota bacterium]
KSVSKSFVSSLTKELDEMVEAWRNSSLEGTCYPYLMVDVLFIKVRENHRVVSKSCYVAIGITEDGDREIIGFLIQDTESEESWSNFFDHLKSRNLKGLKMVISDAHKGLVNAIKACKILDEGFEDAFQYSVNGIAHPRLRSTNLLERLNEEIRRREKVIRIFPNVDSATRLIGAVLIDQQDKWLESSKAYIKI